MRVNITYSEELEKIPSLLGNFVNEVAQGLAMQASEANDITPLVQAEGYNIQAIQKIDTVRRELARLDGRLEDVMSILSGLHNHQMGMTPPPVETQEEPNDDDSGEPT